MEPRNEKIRRQDRILTDRARIEEVLAQAKVLRLGMVDEGRPYVVPLHYGYEWAEAEGKTSLVFYAHGAAEGRKIEVLKKNPEVFVEIDCDMTVVAGDPDIPCTFGAEYASLMGDATATILTDMEEKIHGLIVLMKTQTGRDFEIPEKMAQVTAVFKIVVPEYSAKSRPKATGQVPMPKESGSLPE